MTASPRENRELIGRYLQALSGQSKTPELVARFVDDESLAAHIHDVETAFPAYELIAEELIAERDLVAMRGVFHGVHQGAFAGLRATGRSVSAPLMIIYRIAHGRIVQHWLQFDGAGLVRQLQEPVAAEA